MRKAAGLEGAIAAVSGLSQFMALLGSGEDNDNGSSTIRSLPSSRKALALAALGIRILALPTEEQHAAIESFLELACGCARPWPPLLDEVMSAASRGVRGLLVRERAVVSMLGVAAIRRGEGVRAVAQKLGISSKTWMSFLDGLATSGPGLRAIAQGEELQAVIDRFQISGASHVALLKCAAASGAISRGENVLTAASRLGIDDPAVISSLERVATLRPGFKAVAQGEDAVATARRLGISHPANIALLRNAAERFARQ
jgi:hypothetical protein